MTLTSPRYILFCAAIVIIGSILFTAFVLLDSARVAIAAFAIGAAALTVLFSGKIGNLSLIQRIFVSGLCIGFGLAGLIYIFWSN